MVLLSVHAWVLATFGCFDSGENPVEVVCVCVCFFWCFCGGYRWIDKFKSYTWKKVIDKQLKRCRSRFLQLFIQSGKETGWSSAHLVLTWIFF